MFTLVSNEHIPKVAKRLVQLTHKPNIEQQLIWAGHLSGGGGPTDFDVYFHKMGGGVGRICQKNGLSILRTTCCLFWWKWKYIFLESFESVNSRRKTPSCGRTKKSSNISLEAKKTRITIIKKLFLLRPFTKELFARKKKIQAERGDCFLWPSFLHRREAEVLGFRTMPWSCFLLQNKGSHLQQACSFFEEAEFRLDWTSFLDLCDRKILGVAKISFSCSQP